MREGGRGMGEGRGDEEGEKEKYKEQSKTAKGNKRTHIVAMGKA